MSLKAFEFAKVEDGWLYFIHGWTQVITQVLHFDLTPELLQRLNAGVSLIQLAPTRHL